MNRAVGRAARLTLGLGLLACIASQMPTACGQGQAVVQLRFGNPGMVVAAPGLEDGGDADGDPAIGDPWWDEAEAKGPAAGGNPADAAARAVRGRGLAILRRELSIVRQTCPSLEQQQRAIVLTVGRGMIEKAVEEQIQKQQPKDHASKDHAWWIGFGGRMRDALQASLAANASDAEVVAYAAERGMREDRRKKAVVAAIVADVDREAWLDDAEREALAGVLLESYRERWEKASAEMLRGTAVSNESVLPGIERCVEKAIGQPRKAQWVAARDEARKLERASGNGVVLMQNGGFIQVQAGGAAAGQPPIGRVIQRRVQIGGGGGQMQVEMRVGPASGVEADAADAPQGDRK